MISLRERINAAHKGIRGEAAAGYFSFSHFFCRKAQDKEPKDEIGSNVQELQFG